MKVRQPMEITFEAIDEDRPGAKWRRVYDRHWHGYSRWFLSEGVRKRSTYLASLRALRLHMPELLPVFEEICKVSGGGDLEARFLSMWCPPAYIGGCSQAMIGGAEPALIRNYDYGPKLLEGILLRSRYCGKRVVAMVDSLWGVLDGINEDGLTVSLSFGGSPTVQEGFGIPIVLRYVLEIASNTKEAIAILQRVPIHMAYSIAVLDRAGNHAMVYVSPGKDVEVHDLCVATNHQHKPTWQRHAETTRSVEREAVLLKALASANDPDALLSVFLRPPVYQTSFDRGYGTLYTARYLPQTASLELIWPDQRWVQSCDDFEEGSRTVQYVATPRQ